MHIMKVFKVGLLLNPVKDEDGKIDVRSYRDFYIAVETSGNNKGNIVEVGRDFCDVYPSPQSRCRSFANWSLR